MPGFAIRLKHRRREFCDVANPKQMKREIVVSTLKRTSRRQNDLSVPRGLVDVEVD